MTDRKLARVVKIDSLHPIEGADRIELAFIGGWQVVVQKGLYEVGHLTVYFEVDSMLPTDNPAFADLTKLSSKLLFEVNGKGYARIRTMKLRKQLSQGYCVPLEQLPEVTEIGNVQVDQDLTKLLGILKYEKPEEKSLNNTGGGDVTQRVKTFPSFIPKTDQNRVQNIVPRYLQSVGSGELFEKSFKLDGSSMTTWIKQGELGVASRNVGFNPVSVKRTFVETLKHFISQVWGGGKSFAKAKWEPVIPANDNAFTKMAHEAGLIGMLKEFYAFTGRSIAIQGEMVGPSIQKNFEGVNKNEFFVFDIYDIDAQKYLLPPERQAIIEEYGLRSVPVAGVGTLLPTVAEAIEDADGPSGLKGKMREGWVYKSLERDFSFKVISNRYLLKEE
jgi:RNA ligase (TIGR02306 family)